MTTYRRAGAKWTITECLKLQREFELLKLSVEEIAVLHERSPQAIMYKLDAENFADYNVLVGQQSQRCSTVETEEEEDDDSDSDSDYEEEENADAESEVSEEEYDEEEEQDYDPYNVAQQVKSLTKQVSALTAFIIRTFKSRRGDIFKAEDLAGSR